jgi:hypothetical protein
MKAVVLVVLCVALTECSWSQTYTKARVSHARINPMFQNGQVTGYFLLSSRRKALNATLTVLDDKLREVRSTKIHRKGQRSVTNCIYNGSNFLVTAHYKGSPKTEFILYDSNLREVTNTFKPFGRELRRTNTMMTVPGQGFLIIGNMGIAKKTQVHELQFVDNKLEPRWTTAGNGHPLFLYKDTTVLLSILRRYAGFRIRDIDYELQLQDIRSGSVKFKVPMITDDYSIGIMNARYLPSTKECIVIGQYYQPDDNKLSVQSLGYIKVVYDSTGQRTSVKTLSWEEIGRHAPIDKNATFTTNHTNMIIHYAFWSPDGDIFIVGEQYKVKFSAGGAALGLVNFLLFPNFPFRNSTYGPMNGPTRLDIFDMVVFHFDPDLKFNELQTFHKEPRTVAMEPGMILNTPKYVAEYNDKMGLFDYDFTQLQAARENSRSSTIITTACGMVPTVASWQAQ